MRRFGFSRWAVSLNSMPPGLEALLPPSDMRWRKDVGLLEEGKYEQVGSSLHQLQSRGLLRAVGVQCFERQETPCYAYGRRMPGFVDMHRIYDTAVWQQNVDVCGWLQLAVASCTSKPPNICK